MNHTATRGCLLLTLLLATPLARADVLIVDAAGGGDFTTLSAAVAAAADGDTLLVRNGTYAEPGPVVIDGKALTITGEWGTLAAGLHVTVQPGLVIRNLSPGENVLLQNLKLLGTPGSAVAPATSALLLEDNVSHVRLQSCELLGGFGGHNNQPHGAVAVSVDNSASTAFVSCGLTGGAGQYSPTPTIITGDGAPAVTLSAGQILFYTSSVRGGEGGSNTIGAWPYGGDGASAIAHASGTMFIVTSWVVGGRGGIAHNGGDGGDGLSMGSVGFAWLLGGSSVDGGEGGWSDDGPDGADGIDIVDPAGLVTNFGGSYHDFNITSPLREGQVGVIDLGGDFTDSALVFASLALHQLPFVGHQGVLMLAPQALLGPFLLGQPGNQNVPVVGPMLPPGLQTLQVHVQPAYVGSDGVVLGPGHVLTLLDDTL